jgi:hypothetical protein
METMSAKDRRGPAGTSATSACRGFAENTSLHIRGRPGLIPDVQSCVEIRAIHSTDNTLSYTPFISVSPYLLT